MTGYAKYCAVAQASYAARGFFGQMIYVDPSRRLVIVTSSGWPVASSQEMSQRRAMLIDEITRAVDKPIADRPP